MDAYERQILSAPQTQLRLDDIEKQITKFKNLMDYWEKKVFRGGCIFLLFNFYLTTCFCRIYQNSISCLISNTVMSITFTNCIIFILLLLSAILRIYGLSNEGLMTFSIFTLFNPTFRLYGKKKKLAKDRDNDIDE